MVRLPKSCEEEHFTEISIDVSYFALESVVEWCTAKIGAPQKATLKYSSSAPLAKIFGQYLWMICFIRVAGLTQVLLKNDFLDTYFWNS